MTHKIYLLITMWKKLVWQRQNNALNELSFLNFNLWISPIQKGQLLQLEVNLETICVVKVNCVYENA